MKIAFVWQGFSGRYGQWKDGLYAAMQLIGNDHTVAYFDTDEIDRIYEFAPDVVLYWEAPCTFAGKDRLHYWGIQQLPFKKALLFAGGPIKREWCEGFDLFFVESRINEEEFQALGLPWRRAFGVNTAIFKPEQQPKVFRGAFQATCASWKRHWLLAEAFGNKAAICGRFQSDDPAGFDRARALGAAVFPELSAEGVNALLNMSEAVVNCSDYWGGGQRATLEAMSAGVPVVVMEDSPKNREYVEESQAGAVVAPNPQAIRDVVLTDDMGQRGRDYVLSKWTERHYADALLAGIQTL